MNDIRRAMGLLACDEVASKKVLAYAVSASSAPFRSSRKILTSVYYCCFAGHV